MCIYICIFIHIHITYLIHLPILPEPSSWVGSRESPNKSVPSSCDTASPTSWRSWWTRSGAKPKAFPTKSPGAKWMGKLYVNACRMRWYIVFFFVFSADTKNQTSDHSHADSPLFTLEIETSETMNLLFKDLTLFWTYFYSVIVWFRYFKICSCTLPIFRIFLSFPKIDWCARPVLARLVDVTWSPGRDHCRKGGFMVYPMNTHVTYTYIHK